MTQQPFVEALVRDLSPVRPASALSKTILGWSAAAFVSVLLLLLARGPLRDGALATLMTSPRFAFEFALGLLTSLAAVAAGLEFGVPGRPALAALLGPPVAVLAAWVAFVWFAFAVGAGDAPVSMLGKRSFCSIETLFLTIPGWLVAITALRKRALFHGPVSGMLLGIGVAAFPAAWMQLACMHAPHHTLTHHLGAVGVSGLIGMGYGTWRRAQTD